MVVYLHADTNRDLLEGIVREQLSISQLILLEQLRGHHIRPTMRQAAALMRVSQAGASRIVAGLAERGLVTRAGDDHDYRAKRIAITARGEQVVASMHAARLEHVETFVGELDPDERRQLRATLQELLKREQIAAYRPLIPAA